MFISKKDLIRLNNEILMLRRRMESIEKESRHPKCYEVGDALPDFSILRAVGGHLSAVEDYLKINVLRGTEPDPNYLPEQPKTRIKYFAVKKSSGKKKSK